MAHTVNPVNPITLDPTPGTTLQFNVTVSNAVQPAVNPIAGTISVEFDGHTESTPLTITLDPGIVQPQVDVDFGGSSNITATVGTPVQAGPNGWQVPVTLTVV